MRRIACVILCILVLLGDASGDETHIELARSLEMTRTQWDDLHLEGVSFRQRVNVARFAYLKTTERGGHEVAAFESPRIVEGTVEYFGRGTEFLLRHSLVDQSLPIWIRRGSDLFGAERVPEVGAAIQYHTRKQFSPKAFLFTDLSFAAFGPIRPFPDLLDFPGSTPEVPAGTLRTQTILSEPSRKIVEARLSNREGDGERVLVTTWEFSPGVAGIPWLPTSMDKWIETPTPTGAVRSRAAQLQIAWVGVSISSRTLALPVKVSYTIFASRLPGSPDTVKSVEYAWEVDPGSFDALTRSSEELRLAAHAPIEPRRSEPRANGNPVSAWLIAFVAMSILLVALLIVRARMRRAA